MGVGVSSPRPIGQVVLAMTHGVVYLDDGWQQLVDALDAVVRARGVHVNTRAKVDAIDTQGDGFVVRTASGDLDADACPVTTGGAIAAHS